MNDPSTSTTMNVSMPESLRSFVSERMTSGGFNNASEYIRQLIREDQKRVAQERLDAMLLEGLASGEHPDFDVERIKHDLRTRIAGRRK